MSSREQIESLKNEYSLIQKFEKEIPMGELTKENYILWKVKKGYMSFPDELEIYGLQHYFYDIYDKKQNATGRKNILERDREQYCEIISGRKKGETKIQYALYCRPKKII